MFLEDICFDCSRVQSRHWHDGSQTYASGDQLLRHLEMGWRVLEVRQRIVKRGYHKKTVHHFLIEKDHRFVVMMVVRNPFTDDLLRSFKRHQRAQERTTVEAPVVSVEHQVAAV